MYVDVFYEVLHNLLPYFNDTINAITSQKCIKKTPLQNRRAGRKPTKKIGIDRYSSALCATAKRTKKEPWSLILQGFCLVAGVGFEPHDLRVMSPTSYQAALPRDINGAGNRARTGTRVNLTGF